MQQLFVSGGTGFIGSAFVRCARAAGYHISALSRSPESAAALQALGAEPFAGDLLVPGPWQEAAAAADGVIHLAQPETFGGRVTQKRAEAYRTGRVAMDRNLLEALRPAGSQRIIYVSGTSYYGNLGPDLRDETATPVPMGWGPYIVAALEQVKTYHKRGLAIIEAFPGVIYGPGSWYMELIRFLVKGNPIITMPGRVRYSSYMHVDDCARGLLHLFEHGSPGKRYFLVDDAPSNFVELGMLSSQALGIETRRQSVPYWLIRLLFGAVLADSSRYENRLSNATLRATGFQLQFPTLQVGVPNAIEQIKQTSPEITRLAAKRKR